MASWMVHLRVADKLIDRLDNITPTEFVMGNIAPDSGVPNADWSAFFPDKNTTHFYNKAKGNEYYPYIDIAAFTAQYFTKELQSAYTPEQFSFFLGYLVHLLTDALWNEQIYKPSMEKYAAEFPDQTERVWQFKGDWYDLDFLYLKKHPDFRAFSLYRNASGFENTYMDIFSRDAFDNRREYITGFYSEKRDDLEREYRYLTEEAAEAFVTESSEHIYAQLKNYI